MVTRRSYSKEFKIEAVRLLGLGEKPAPQLALELGIRRNQLYKWRDQLAAHGSRRNLSLIYCLTQGVQSTNSVNSGAGF